MYNYNLPLRCLPDSAKVHVTTRTDNTSFIMVTILLVATVSDSS